MILTYGNNWKQMDGGEVYTKLYNDEFGSARMVVTYRGTGCYGIHINGVYVDTIEGLNQAKRRATRAAKTGEWM